MRELTFKEKYMLLRILRENNDKWSESQTYQGLRALFEEEMVKYIKEVQKNEITKEYEGLWVK